MINEQYVFNNGYKAKREYKPINVKGTRVPPKGKWVLRTADGNFVDMDVYRNDMFDRHNLKVSKHTKDVSRSRR